LLPPRSSKANARIAAEVPKLADISAIIGLLDIVFGEIDR
jgi:NADH:ubiquinone oxidoreductase subunit D